MEQSVVAVVAVAIIFAFDSVSSQGACTNGCDIQVSDLQVTGIEVIEPDKDTKFDFAVTFKNAAAGEKVTAVTARDARNFDCTIMFASWNIEGSDYTTDTIAIGTKTGIADQTKQCVVNNVKDMSNQLLPGRKRTLYGTCTLKLKKEDCAKANFICVDCPRPQTASYTSDQVSTNNDKCVYIRSKIICDGVRKCFKGQNLERESKMCTDPKANCVVAREGLDGKSGPVIFGCTSDEDYCKDRKCCKICNEDNCNTKPDNCIIKPDNCTIKPYDCTCKPNDNKVSDASSVRASTAAILALAFYQARVMLA